MICFVLYQRSAQVIQVSHVSVQSPIELHNLVGHVPIFIPLSFIQYPMSQLLGISIIHNVCSCTPSARSICWRPWKIRKSVTTCKLLQALRIKHSKKEGLFSDPYTSWEVRHISWKDRKSHDIPNAPRFFYTCTIDHNPHSDWFHPHISGWNTFRIQSVVGGLEHVIFHILGIALPIDRHCQRGFETTSHQCFVNWRILISWSPSQRFCFCWQEGSPLPATPAQNEAPATWGMGPSIYICHR